MKNKVLHVMVADNKFTLPLVNYILNDLKLNNHRFLIFESSVKCSFVSKNIICVNYPNSFDLFKGFYPFCKEFLNADVVVSHGGQVSFYFIFFLNRLKKVIWLIHGGIDLPKMNKSKGLKQVIKRGIENLVKKNAGFYSTHIEEDSWIAKKILGSNSGFVYSPMYLSNVSEKLKEPKDFIYQEGFVSKTVLVGNSTDPHNNHLDSFNKIADSGLDPKLIVSILSYGVFKEYSEGVIREGFDLFGSKFKPIAEFLSIEAYLELLDSVDFVVFNHERQEAMGATIQLLSLAKPIFFNPKSPAYNSLKRRGYKVFSIDDLKNYREVKMLDLRVNHKLLKEQYNKQLLQTFYLNL
jgi:dTDP-N-acetylfucosamine:lipid II N-acetylfucosaminyltransferase